MRLLLVLLSAFLLCARGWTQDSVRTPETFAVHLPGTNAVLNPGMSLAQIQAALPGVEMKKPTDFFGYQLLMVELPSEIGKYVFSPALVEDKLSLITLVPADNQPPEAQTRLDKWFQSALDATSAKPGQREISGSDTTDNWTSAQATWQRKAETNKQTRRVHYAYVIMFPDKK